MIKYSRLKSNIEDILEVATLVKKRGHKKSLDELCIGFSKELTEFGENKLRIYIAKINQNVVGFCRIRLFEKYEFPEAKDELLGWYLMGIIICENHRRKGIGTRLSEMAMKDIKKENDIFVLINKENNSSIEMHKNLGFEIIAKGDQFFKVSFSGGNGYILKREKGV